LNGVVQIDSSFGVSAYRRNPVEIAADSRVARVGDVLVNAPVAEYAPNFDEVLGIQLDELEGTRPAKYSGSQALDSAEALVLAFEASRVGRRLQFPATPDVLANCVDWNIS